MGHEGFPTEIQSAPETQKAPNPMQKGAEWLFEQGVGYEVAGIQLVGPNPACRGTLAEMVGIEGHSDMKDSVGRTITDAVKAGRDPSEAVASGISFFAKRDEKGDIMRVSEDELKKNSLRRKLSLLPRLE